MATLGERFLVVKEKALPVVARNGRGHNTLCPDLWTGMGGSAILI